MNLRLFHAVVSLLVSSLLVTTALSPSANGQTTHPAFDGGVALVPFSGGDDPYNTGRVSGWFPGSNVGGAIGAGILPTPMMLSERLWLRLEYLHWKPDGMDIPALVTSSPAGTDQFDAGVLGEPGTNVRLGGKINDDGTSGIRWRSGFWLTPQGTFAIEGEYFELLGDQNDGFRSGPGSGIVARPFFDNAPNRSFETAQLINFPDVVNGSLRVSSSSGLRSALINGRVAMCPLGGCNPYGHRDRVDWIIGYRHLELKDSLSISESLESAIVNAPGTIAINEKFATRNRFNGLQLGMVHQTHLKRAWLESMLRVAIGTNSQKVNISGTTAITEAGTTERFSGGLLAQTSNIGKHERDEFTMIPEVGITLGFHLTDWLDATIGYTALYFPNVVRPGDQISTDLNSNQFPERTNPFTGPLRPEFQFRTTDYLVHGLSIGGELRF